MRSSAPRLRDQAARQRPAREQRQAAGGSAGKRCRLLSRSAARRCRACALPVCEPYRMSSLGLPPSGVIAPRAQTLRARGLRPGRLLARQQLRPTATAAANTHAAAHTCLRGDSWQAVRSAGDCAAPRHPRPRDPSAATSARVLPARSGPIVGVGVHLRHARRGRAGSKAQSVSRAQAVKSGAAARARAAAARPARARSARGSGVAAHTAAPRCAAPCRASRRSRADAPARRLARQCARLPAQLMGAARRLGSFVFAPFIFVAGACAQLASRRLPLAGAAPVGPRQCSF